MDPRLALTNGHIADARLAGQVQADRFITPDLCAIGTPVADILDAPQGRRQRQCVFGEPVQVLTNDGTWALVQAGRAPGYVGHMTSTDLCPHPGATTHWVTALSTHAYAAPDFKSPEQVWLPFGAQLCATGADRNFVETKDGFVPKQSLSPVEFTFSDPAQVAQMFLGTPYLWGGNSAMGLDCSGLVHTALTAAGMACPGDADLQESFVAPSMVAARCDTHPYARNQVLFWKGHVALTLDADRLIHANVHAMAVTIEGITAAIDRIFAAGDGPVTSRAQI